jgi:hypothetical protein
MAANTKMTINLEDTPDASMEFHGTWKELYIASADKDGDVLMEFYDGNAGGTSSFYFDQEQLKALITHLQKQIK